MVGSSLIQKKKQKNKFSRNDHSLSLVVIRCHLLYHSVLLVVPLVVIRCHSTYHPSVFLWDIRKVGPESQDSEGETRDPGPNS